jgi:predicted GIY-YIG superfamily endonuclease
MENDNPIQKFIIYSISSNGKVFYIGRTCDLKRRKKEHLLTRTNTYTSRKIKKLKTLNEPIEFNILHENITFDESIKLEIKEIKEHKDNGIKLTNLTDGGEGLFGVKRDFTDEWKNNLKIASLNFYKNGGIPVNKGKKLEDLVGTERAKEIKENISIKVNLSLETGKKTIHNKNKKLEDIVTSERALEIKKIISDTAKKTFTGKKQTQEHIDKRIQKQKETVSNRSLEEKEKYSKIRKKIAEDSSKKSLFNVDGFEHYGTWRSLSKALLNERNIKISPEVLSRYYRGTILTNKAGIKNIIIES